MTTATSSATAILKNQIVPAGQASPVLLFDGCEGHPLPALPPAQRSAFGRNAVDFRYRGAPSASQGECMTWRDCSKETADGLADYARSLVYTDVDLTIVGLGTFAGLTCVGVEQTWNARAGAVYGGVLEIRFKFEDITLYGAVVQSSPDMVTWTAVDDMVCQVASKGLGTYAGEATGVIRSPDTIPDIVGQFIRALNPTSPADPIWMGTCAGYEIAGAPGEYSIVTFHFTGLPAVLDKMVITEWYDMRQETAAGNVNPDAYGYGNDGYAAIMMPTFNEAKRGDRSNAAVALPVDRSVFLSAKGDPNNKWSALALVTAACAIAQKLWCPNLPITVKDSTGLFVAGVRISTADQLIRTWKPVDTLLQLIAQVFHQDYGLGFFVGAQGAAIVIEVFDIYSTSNTVAVDLKQAKYFQWSLSRDASNQVDTVYVQGPRPLFGWSWAANGGPQGNRTTMLNNGWTSDEWTTANALAAANALDPTLNTRYANVGRRFVLAPGWQGDSDLTPGALVPSVRHLDAFGQETGGLDGATDKFPNAMRNAILENQLPYQWADLTSLSFFADLRQTRARPIVLLKTISGATFRDISTLFDVHVSDDLAAIIIGKDWNDAQNLQALMGTDGSRQLVVVAGFRHPLNLRASRNIEGADIPGTPPRTPRRSSILHNDDPVAQGVYLHQDIIYGLNADYTAQRIGASGWYEAGKSSDGSDEFTAISALVELAGAAWKTAGQPSDGLSFTQRGLDAPAPVIGNLVASVSYWSSYPDSQQTVTTQAVVSRISYNFVPGQESVRWECQQAIAAAPYLTRATPGKPVPVNGFLRNILGLR